MSLSISNVFTHTSILLFCCVPLFFLYFPKFSFPTLRILYIRHSALRIPHSRFPLTVLFTYSVSVDSIKYPLLMCRFEEKTGVLTTECGMRSEWCITRDLCLEWGISFLLEISAYIKINVKKDQNKDVSTVRRSFSRWEVKKLACFLLGATWKWPSNGRNVVIPFLTFIFIFWNPFRKICRDLRLWLEVGILDYHISNHAWSQNLDTCIDFKNLWSLAIIGKQNYIVATFTGIFMAHYGHT